MAKRRTYLLVCFCTVKCIFNFKRAANVSQSLFSCFIVPSHAEGLSLSKKAATLLSRSSQRSPMFLVFYILFLLRLLSNTLLLSHIWGKDHQAGRRTMKEYTHVSEGFHPTEQQCPRTEPRHFTVWVGVGALPTQTLRNWKWPFVSPSSFPWPAMSDQPFISIYSSLTPKKSLRFSINTTLTTSDFPEWVWY